MVIWSEFRMGQYRGEDHREEAPHFIILTNYDRIWTICTFQCNLTIWIVPIWTDLDRFGPIWKSVIRMSFISECWLLYGIEFWILQCWSPTDNQSHFGNIQEPHKYECLDITRLICGIRAKWPSKTHPRLVLQWFFKLMNFFQKWRSQTFQNYFFYCCWIFFQKWR